MELDAAPLGPALAIGVATNRHQKESCDGQ
jgi:hypothetical protein